MPPSFDTPVRGSHWNIALRFGIEKLEWCGYQMVKKFEDMITCFDRMHERDGQQNRQTDRQTDTAHTSCGTNEQRRDAIEICSVGLLVFQSFTD